MKTKWQQDLKRILGLKYEMTHNMGDVLKCKHKDVIEPIFIMMITDDEFVIYAIDDMVTKVETNEVYNKKDMNLTFEECERVYGG